MVLRAAEPLRVEVVPEERTVEEPARDTPAAEVRETLVRPVEVRRTGAPLPETELPPLRVARERVLPEPPRETKLRVLPLPSRPPIWRA